MPLIFRCPHLPGGFFCTPANPTAGAVMMGASMLRAQRRVRIPTLGRRSGPPLHLCSHATGRGKEEPVLN